MLIHFINEFQNNKFHSNSAQQLHCCVLYSDLAIVVHSRRRIAYNVNFLYIANVKVMQGIVSRRKIKEKKPYIKVKRSSVDHQQQIKKGEKKIKIKLQHVKIHLFFSQRKSIKRVNDQ